MSFSGLRRRPARPLTSCSSLSIVFSVFTVMLDSVREIHQAYGSLLYGVEWFFTILFSVLGEVLAAVIMIIGYAIIAVPTGIVSVEFSLAVKKG